MAQARKWKKMSVVNKNLFCMKAKVHKLKEKDNVLCDPIMIKTNSTNEEKDEKSEVKEATAMENPIG